MSSAKEELAALIEAKGQEIRTLKAEGTTKDVLKPHVDELLMLKAKFQTTTGEAYVAPGQEKKKKPLAASPPALAGEGTEAADPNKKSKKQLQREKKEAEKAAAKAKAKEEREKKQAEDTAKGVVAERCVFGGARKIFGECDGNVAFEG